MIGLADVARDQGGSARVREYAGESLAILRELRIQWMIGFALNTLAQGAYIDGDLIQAGSLAAPQDSPRVKVNEQFWQPFSPMAVRTRRDSPFQPVSAEVQWVVFSSVGRASHLGGLAS